MAEGQEKEAEVVALFQQMIRADQDAVLRFMRVRVEKYGAAKRKASAEDEAEAEGDLRLSRLRLRIARNDSGAVYLVN